MAETRMYCDKLNAQACCGRIAELEAELAQARKQLRRMKQHRDDAAPFARHVSVCEDRLVNWGFQDLAERWLKKVEKR